MTQSPIMIITRSFTAEFISGITPGGSRKLDKDISIIRMLDYINEPSRTGELNTNNSFLLLLWNKAISLRDDWERI